ncbi:MAG: copper chaperone PCu(A)C [Gammaproteobacteria bacterium]
MKKLLNVFLLLFVFSAAAFAQNENIPNDTKNAEAVKPVPANPAPITPAPANPAPIKNSDLVISGAYVQPLIPGQNNTAAYMTIDNNSKVTYVLKGAFSSMAEKVELHSVSMQDGVMKMRAVETITLLPGQELVLQPGDFHLMLINVNNELTTDTLVPICLEFQNSANICKDVPVVDKRTVDQHNH